MRFAVEAHWTTAASQNPNTTATDESWDSARRTGGVFTEVHSVPLKLADTVLSQALSVRSPSAQLLLVAYPHIYFYDGRGADKPWLQENPEPVSQIVWDSWAEIHPDTAQALGISDDDVVKISSPLGAVALPAKVDLGVQPQCVAVPLGQGHTALGRYASGRGGNPWPLLPPDSLRVPITVERTGAKHKLVSPLFTADMMRRPIVEKISLDDVKQGRQPPPDEPPPPQPYELWPEHVYEKHHWGMTIDLNSCTGCGGCVTACYAENNLTVVGREGVRMGRIMSWLRLERYFPDDLDARRYT